MSFTVSAWTPHSTIAYGVPPDWWWNIRETKQGTENYRVQLSYLTKERNRKRNRNSQHEGNKIQSWWNLNLNVTVWSPESAQMNLNVFLMASFSIEQIYCIIAVVAGSQHWLTSNICECQVHQSRAELYRHIKTHHCVQANGSSSFYGQTSRHKNQKWKMIFEYPTSNSHRQMSRVRVVPKSNRQSHGGRPLDGSNAQFSILTALSLLPFSGAVKLSVFFYIVHFQWPGWYSSQSGLSSKVIYFSNHLLFDFVSSHSGEKIYCTTNIYTLCSWQQIVNWKLTFTVLNCWLHIDKVVIGLLIS